MGIGLENFCTTVARRCDSCKIVAAVAFCRVDSAFLCLNCDTKIHNDSNTNKHERVWMCEVCEQAPAAVTCRADAASLCVNCDTDIHSANPLARRHERVPVEPFFESAADQYVAKTSSLQLLLAGDCVVNGNNMSELKSGDLFFAEMGGFVDLECQNQNSLTIENQNVGGKFHQESRNMNVIGNDSVVPVQHTNPITVTNDNVTMFNTETGTCFDIDFCRSKLSSFTGGYPSKSLSQSVSSSSHEVGVVPDGNSMSEISYPFSQNMSFMCVNSNPVDTVQQVSYGMDREARVMRYKEKRKNRKFEKTIRYASRKAYAETRPRIKGRFVKRVENVETDMDCLFDSPTTSVPFVFDAAYGVVPSLG